jgi:hypothetical protein
MSTLGPGKSQSYLLPITVYGNEYDDEEELHLDLGRFLITIDANMRHKDRVCQR